MKRLYRFLSVVIVLLLTATGVSPQPVYAEDKSTDVSGQVYVLEDEDGKFDHSKTTPTASSSGNTYGNFSLVGDIKKAADKDGISAFDAEGTVDEATGEDQSEVSFLYSYDDSLLNADESKDWKLYSADAKKIGDLSLDEKIGNGAIIVQSSFDGESWCTDLISTDVFKTTSENESDTFYTTTVNQLVNGCYYKVTVAYATRKKSGNKKIGPVKVGTKYNYQEHIETYEFYICNPTENAKAAKDTDTPKYNLKSDPVSTGMDNGYSGRKAVETDDVHSGWKIGQFFINGFSGNAHFYQDDQSKKENPIFLKNVGDKVTLWFHLDQKDIESLNGDEHLSIVSDEKGSDRDLNVNPQNFKRGALIVKFTDYQNNTRTNVYTDYLAAAATTTANTKVQLFEEGDYEVALDYEIKDNSPLAWKIPKPAKTTAYRVSFKFSVRNSNCMVYPMDLKTGSELRTFYTENGFRLDLARSRYLDLSIKKRVLTSDGLDLRESQISDEKDDFTDEGIYEFTVKNNITDDKVTKTIYVGTNNLLKAYVKYGGEYSIADLKEEQESGYEFADDGTITAPEPEVQEELDDVAENVSSESDAQTTTEAENVPVVVNTTKPETASENIESTKSVQTSSDASPEDTEEEVAEEKASNPFPLGTVLIIAVIAILCLVFLNRKKGEKKPQNQNEEDNNSEEDEDTK